MKAKIEMTFKKDTKRTVVYVNEEEGASVSQVYIQKAAFEEGKFPKEITLTIEAE